MRKNNDSFQISPDEFKNRIRSYWNGVSSDYNKFPPGFEEEDALKIFFSKELGEEKLRILDIGTGAGFLLLLLAELGHEVVGVDLSEGMLSVAIKKAKERRLDLDLRIGDAESLDFDDASFDAVVSRWVLWTLQHPEKAISEWMQVLKPGGQAYAFGGIRARDKEGISGRIKRNLGMFLIRVIERRNAWIIRSRYGKDLDGKNLGPVFTRAQYSFSDDS